MVDALLASLKAAAVGGIFMVWTKITIEPFKLSWHIISTSPGEEKLKIVPKVMCEECKEFFIDESGEDGKYVCFTCQGI